MSLYDDSSPSTDSGDESVDDGVLFGEAPCMYNNIPYPSTLSPEQDDVSTSELSEEGKVMAARAYQLEMLEASLKQNVIVAMDTGSGKTQVAVLRIMAELEKAPIHQRIWFLAPTVPLCAQQFEVLKAQVPAVQCKFLSGGDNVENWSTRKVWDGVLHNVRIVVSPYQILLEALGHAFVTMESLALIVFDEAHNCTKNHPGRRIMTEFYRPSKAAGRSIPAILGLTASPVMRSSLNALEMLEASLDSVCKTPTRHREELLTHVKRPTLISVSYNAKPEDLATTSSAGSVRRLHQLFENLDIKDDPYIQRLQANHEAENSDKTARRLTKALSERDTYTQKQLKSFCHKSRVIETEFGIWAAEYYVYEVVQLITQTLESGSLGTPMGGRYTIEEKQYQVDLLRSIGATMPPTPPPLAAMSEKLQALFRILTAYEGAPVGIIFVRERAAVAVLTYLLSSHPVLHDRYRIASMVGTSQYRGKLDPLDLSRAADMTSLHHFRSGRKNLLVATSVLEEGIDVPVCNLVVCVDPPANLKSFIQRRGRARMHASQLYLLVEETSGSAKAWESLEDKMKQQYADEMRELREIEAVEESETSRISPLTVEETGARLTVDDAKGHLQHFCSSLSSRKFVDWRPDYIVHNDKETGLLRATVLLPLSLPAHVRRVDSIESWRAEKNACKDAAFQAYKALHQAGLVNSHLLPMKEVDFSRAIEARTGLAVVSEQFNPWHKIARGWASGPHSIHRRSVRLLDEQSEEVCCLDLVLPVPIPDLPTVRLFWGPDSVKPLTFTVDSDTLMSDTDAPSPAAAAEDAADQTESLLAISYGHRWQFPSRHQLCRFASAGEHLSLQRLGSRTFHPLHFRDGESVCLVRDDQGLPYIYEGWLRAKPPIGKVRQPFGNHEEAPDDVPYVAVVPWPKRPGYFHQLSGPVEEASDKPYTRVLPASMCRTDEMPLGYARFSSLIPFLTSVLETRLVATELLSSTKLGQIGITDLALVATAITASVSRGPTNYERLEFLGDSILKLCASICCAANNLHFPEGYLSLLKDALVANSRLFRAATDFTLDRFIVTKQCNIKDWRKLYETDLLHQGQNPSTQTRKLSTKTVADVVEALIGASYIDGGIPRALDCIALFLPEIEWHQLDTGRQILFDAAPSGVRLPPALLPLEELMGYSFVKKSLLIEATTHSSCTAPDVAACLERLEFIGDSVLDYLVVSHLFAHADPSPLAHMDMHLLRTALVNGDFLAFLALEWSASSHTFSPASPPSDPSSSGTSSSGTSSNPPTALVQESIETPLWAFLSFHSTDLALEAGATSERHVAGRAAIRTALTAGPAYPWAPLARLRANKFFSDLFEALLGAVWVDSGSFDACATVLERAGLLPLLRRMLGDGMHVLHPKEELGLLAGQEKVVYEVREVPVEEGEGEVERDYGQGERRHVYVCRVSVGARVVAEVGGGLWKEESKVRAAEEAVRVLKGESVAG